MLNRQQKSKIVDDLRGKFERQKIAIFSNFSGVSVSKFKTLRRGLKKHDAEYKVTKKTLLERALESSDFSLGARKLKNEIGIMFGYGEETAPARFLVKFGKENETLKILGGLLGKRVLNDKETMALAKLPPKEVLIPQLLNILQFPLRGLATVLQGNLRNLVVVLDKIRSTKSEIRNNN